MIALSFVRSHTEQLGIAPDAADKAFHIHVPAGAVPKDGPSAGVTMTTAIVSLLSGRLVKSTVGMTGEVTLQGLVLPIGRANQKDLDAVPESIRNQMPFHLASRVEEVLDVAFETAKKKSREAA